MAPAVNCCVSLLEQQARIILAHSVYQQRACGPAQQYDSNQPRVLVLAVVIEAMVSSVFVVLHAAARQAELHTMVLQREQAALRALQESKVSALSCHLLCMLSVLILFTYMDSSCSCHIPAEAPH